MDDRQVDLFKIMIYEYMLNKSNRFENDKNDVFNNVSLHRLSSDDYYSMLVTEIQDATARNIFREIKQIIDDYL